MRRDSPMRFHPHHDGGHDHLNHNAHSERGRAFGPDASFGPDSPFGASGPGARRRSEGDAGPFDPDLRGPRSGGGRGGFGGGRGGGRGGGFGGGRGGGGRARRGDVRAAVLTVLAETDAHGYQIIQDLAEKTQGRWQPSPGSVYPVLQLLEESGLATSSDSEGKRVYSLTDEGRAAAAEAATTGRQPWDVEAGAGHKLADQTHLLHAAVRQVGAAGTPEQIERAIAIVDAARRDLYTILAES